MAIKIRLTGKFNLMYRNLVSKDAPLKDLVAQKMDWFRENPNDTRLINHKLKRRLKGKWAFSITNNIRIVYEWQGKNTVRFLAIGTHPQVYRTKKQRQFSS